MRKSKPRSFAEFILSDRLCENSWSTSTLRGASGQAPSTAFSPEPVEGSGRTVKCLICNVSYPFVVSPVEP